MLAHALEDACAREEALIVQVSAAAADAQRSAVAAALESAVARHQSQVRTRVCGMWHSSRGVCHVTLMRHLHPFTATSPYSRKACIQAHIAIVTDML
jgi:hypothetical protein